ncbi:MAG: hypothetical protein ACYTFI_08685, partial [Planctomycetota bacterium]
TLGARKKHLHPPPSLVSSLPRAGAGTTGPSRIRMIRLRPHAGKRLRRDLQPASPSCPGGTEDGCRGKA